MALPNETPFERARRELEDEKNGAIHPDRLPTGFFGAPPKTSPFWTKRAAIQRDWAVHSLGQDRLNVAGALIHEADRRLGLDPYEYAGVFEHNRITLAAAFGCAEAGLRVVDSHCLTNEGLKTTKGHSIKVPRGAKWQLRATTDSEAITDFWQGVGQYPANKDGNVFEFAPARAARNYSIATGGRVMALDLDGDAGSEWLEAHSDDLPATVTQTTGSGGTHMLFRVPEGHKVQNSASAIAVGVDIRGEGGQIIGGGSIHPSGNFYLWHESKAPWEHEIADAPEWLVAAAVAASGVSTARRSADASNFALGPYSADPDAPRGFDEWCSSIGDGTGQRGFHSPILSASISWWIANGLDADPVDLFETLRDVIATAPMKEGRENVRRYTDDDDYLWGRIDYAESVVKKNFADVDEDNGEPAHAGNQWLDEGPLEFDADSPNANYLDGLDNLKAGAGAERNNDAADDGDTGAADKSNPASAGEDTPRRKITDPLFERQLVNGCWVKGEGKKLAKNTKKVRSQMCGAMREMYSFVVLDGSDARAVFQPDRGAAPVFTKKEGLRDIFSNRTVFYDTGPKKPGQLNPAQLFINDPDRLTFIGTQFEPDEERAVADRFNLWTGFKSAQVEGDWSLLRGHIREQMIEGNESDGVSSEYLFSWFMTFLADLVQHPGRKPGSAMAILGEQGAGKSKLADWLREMVGAAAVKITQRSHFVGTFNAHLDAKILAVLEEAFWSGDKAAAGVAKDLISSESIMIERKGVDGVERPNYIRFIFISNESWVIPTDDNADARRFAVFRVNNNKKQDAAFFAAIDRQMKNGGLEAMMHELATWDPTAHGLTWDALRNPPWTPAKGEQATYGVHGARAKLLAIVEAGVLAGAGKDGVRFTYDLDDSGPTAVLREHLVAAIGSGKDHGGAAKDVAAAITSILGDAADKGDSKRNVTWTDPHLQRDASGSGGQVSEEGDDCTRTKKGRWVEVPALSTVRESIAGVYK